MQGENAILSKQRVSILVLVDVGVKTMEYPLFSLFVLRVSILVLVDVGVKTLLSMCDMAKEVLCFNPCFGGCRG